MANEEPAKGLRVVRNRRTAVKMPALTEKQTRFVAEYPKDFDACNAARRAGYAEKNAKQAGYELVRHPIVQEQLVEHLNRVNRQGVLSMQNILERDSDIADLDPLDAFKDDGSVRDLSDIPLRIRKNIAMVKRGKEGDYEVRFHGPHPSLERLAKYHGIIGGSPGSLPRPHGEVEADETIETDESRALIAAEWLVSMGQRHDTDSIMDLVRMLREQPKEIEEADVSP